MLIATDAGYRAESGSDKCARLAHYAQENDLSLREANQKLGFVSDEPIPEDSAARRDDQTGSCPNPTMQKLGVQVGEADALDEFLAFYPVPTRRNAFGGSFFSISLRMNAEIVP